MLNFLVAQINPIVGDLEYNTKLIVDAYNDGVARGLDVVVLPECALTGYPIDDLVNRPEFMRRVTGATNEIMQKCRTKGTALVFGTPYMLPNQEQPFNAVWFIDPDANICYWQPKIELPNYGLFDDKRNFIAGSLDFVNVITYKNTRIGLMICEDVWHDQVAEHLAEQNPDVVIVCNGSPYEEGKNVVRVNLIETRVHTMNCPILYVNMVGGQDEIVFDGGSFAMDTNHNVIQLPNFEVNHYKVSIPLNPMLTIKSNKIVPTSDEDTYKAIVMGTQDYLTKQRFNKVVLGMSGGIDSGIVAAIACDAVGPENVLLVGLPSVVSSEGSVTDSEDAAEMLGAKYVIRPIEKAVQTFFDIVEEDFAGTEVDTSEENIQARTRGVILMAISNKQNRILLTTGNRSENSVGYFTLYGDSCGGFNPIKNIYKTQVWRLAKLRNTMNIPHWFKGNHGQVIPDAIIEKIPSAELREGQKDSDSLPDYPVLDAILRMLDDEELSIATIIAQGFNEVDVRKVARLVKIAEYKRRQTAPGPNFSGKAFGRARRYPIVNGFKE